MQKRRAHAHDWMPPGVSLEERLDLIGPGITATSFILALSLSLLALILGVRSPLVAGGTACAMFLAATSVQILARRYAVRTVLLMAAAATVLALAGLSAGAFVGRSPGLCRSAPTASLSPCTT